jgi:hypothetical protein
LQITNSKLINEIKIQMDSSAIVGVFHAVLFAQEKTVTGVVTDATGPLPGVNVLIKGSRTGANKFRW